MEKLEKIIDRLKVNEIKYEKDTYHINIADEHTYEIIGTEPREMIIISIGRGKRTEKITLKETSSFLDDYLDSKFHEYRYIDGYDAIWSSKNKLIECQLSCRMMNKQLFRKIERMKLGENNLDNEPIEEEQLSPKSEFFLFTIGEQKIFLSNASNEFLLLHKDKMRYRQEISEYANRVLTLRIENCDVSTHDCAKELLERIAFTTVFLLSEANVPIRNVAVETKGISTPRSKNNYNISDGPLVINKPQYEYDIEAISLYLHAKSRETIPLYSFLAFYQVLEYYFPKYSEQKLKNELKRILKDPKLNIENDSHLDEIIKITKPSKGNLYGDEVSQLKETIIGCSNATELFQFLDSLNCQDYFSGKTKSNISSKKVNIKPENVSIIEQITERIYDIRCNIVHKKANFIDNHNSIRPNTIGYSDIFPDLELMQYLAYKIIIENSYKFKI